MSWKWRELSQRSGKAAAVPVAEALGALTADMNPEHWRRFTCPRCGKASEYPSAIPDPPEICGECLDDLRKLKHRAGRTRDEILSAADAPPEYCVPFIEPALWPIAQAFPRLDLRAWSGDPWCVLLVGTVNGGKTMLATELLCRAATKKGEARWIRAGAVPQLCFDQDLGSENFLRFCTVPVLLLDDLGRGHDGRAWNVLIELLSQRHQYRRATIITTNRTVKRLREADPPGLFDEDAALARRLTAGAIIAFKGRWSAPERSGA